MEIGVEPTKTFTGNPEPGGHQVGLKPEQQGRRDPGRSSGGRDLFRSGEQEYTTTGHFCQCCIFPGFAIAAATIARYNRI